MLQAKRYRRCERFDDCSQASSRPVRNVSVDTFAAALAVVATLPFMLLAPETGGRRAAALRPGA